VRWIGPSVYAAGQLRHQGTDTTLEAYDVDDLVERGFCEVLARPEPPPPPPDPTPVKPFFYRGKKE
jgi:hypothetical protein